MENAPPNLLPHLIIVAGRPGSGKTSLAHALAQAIRCPAICRDEIKEGVVNTVGPPLPDDINWRVYDAFFETITLLLSHGVTLVAEAAFQHKLWAPKLEPLLNIARMKIIVCTVDPQLARNRHIERGLADPLRERFHPDPIGETYDPPHFDAPMINVDTTDGYRPALEEIVSFARSP